MMQKNKIGISTISHPPCIPYLLAHLEAIKEAISRSGFDDIPVSLFVSQTTEDHEETINYIASKVGLKNLNTSFLRRPSTIGESRNLSIKNITNDTEWVIVTDSDTKMRPDYIINLNSYLDEFDLENVGALCGTVGIMKATQVGLYEAYMEANVVATRVHGCTTDDFNLIFGKNRNLPIKSAINNNSSRVLSKFAGNECEMLQGYNHVISYKTFQERGYNPKYGSAEDREMMAYIRSTGNKILFAPKCQIDHDFDISFEQMMRRKTVHGRWAQLVREEYAQHGENIFGKPEISQWMEADKIDATQFPYETAEGRTYLTAARIAYSYGNMETAARLHMHHNGNPDISLIQFNDHRSGNIVSPKIVTARDL
ncbi:MAG: glycosyltransferase family 2 protein [Rickettsiales bacterium]|nr:glycosyltransferase family 2 protein [Rickettsiales bacterium]